MYPRIGPHPPEGRLVEQALLGGALDGRWRFHGVEVRAVGAFWSLPQSDDLREVFKADVQLRDRRYGEDELGWNIGFGYMF